MAKVVYLRTERQLAHAIEILKAVTLDEKKPLEMVIRESTKKRVQEQMYHAQIGEIAAQYEFMGQKWCADDMKRFLVDAFERYMQSLGTPLKRAGRMMPSLDGAGVVQLGIQTRAFTAREASDFIEFLNFFAAEKGIAFTDSTRASEYDVSYFK
jgi:hypothetical protein